MSDGKANSGGRIAWQRGEPAGPTSATRLKDMRPMRISLIAVAVMTGVILCGCGASNTVPVAPKPTLNAEEQAFEAVWEASREVLKTYHWRIDRQDRRTGTITTHPMLGKQAFEFWRKDTTTSNESLTSTVGPIYRTATVTIKKVGKGRFTPVVSIITSRPLPAAKHPKRDDLARRVLAPGASGMRKGIEAQRTPVTMDELGETLPSPKELQTKMEKEIRQLAAGKLRG